jgi:hypothetical protein
MDSRYQRPKYQAHRRSPATARGVGEACARAPGSSPDNTVGLPRRFQATVGIINGVDVAKFPAVLTRLIRKLHTKVSEPGGSARALASTRPLCANKATTVGAQGEAFSEDEAAQLAGMFGLSGVRRAASLAYIQHAGLG